MSAPLVALVMIIYLGVALSEYRHGNTGMAVVFFGYAVSNIGFILTFK
jgi:hypothetical protein